MSGLGTTSPMPTPVGTLRAWTRSAFSKSNPTVVDFSAWPGQSADTLHSRIAAAETDLRREGFAVIPCQAPNDPAGAERAVREALTDQRYDVIEIGS